LALNELLNVEEVSKFLKKGDNNERWKKEKLLKSTL
jgi:hypothetical protein